MRNGQIRPPPPLLALLPPCPQVQLYFSILNSSTYAPLQAMQDGWGMGGIHGLFIAGPLCHSFLLMLFSWSGIDPSMGCRPLGSMCSSMGSPQAAVAVRSPCSSKGSPCISVPAFLTEVSPLPCPPLLPKPCHQHPIHTHFGRASKELWGRAMIVIREIKGFYVKTHGKD